MKTPLYNKLIEYSKSKLPFHMPGHKFGAIADMGNMNMCLLDNTEAIGMDNLYTPDGVIKEAMTLMSEFYSSKKSIFLTNGSTTGILTSILAICKPGDQLIVARNSHYSVWNALILADVLPIYINSEYIYEENILGEIHYETVEKALMQYPQAKGVLIVSPTYEGVVSDIKSIADVVHKHNKILIVDEAHGAHFVLGNDFPESGVKQGADLVINSMHKTLPALTQSALLHICSDRICEKAIIEALRMIQTSSPSYVMMGIMDYIRNYILENKVKINIDYIQPLIKVRHNLKSKLKVLHLVELESKQYDISKIVISTSDTNISGTELADLLNKDYNIAVEAVLESYIILMTTMADNNKTLMELERALLDIDKDLKKNNTEKNVDFLVTKKISLGHNPREVFYSPKLWVLVEESLGRLAAKNIMLYPPGIPIVAIGEVLKLDDIKYINKLKHKLQGVKVIDDVVLIQVVK